MFGRKAFPPEENPYIKPVAYIVNRDGKRLPVNHTLAMAREVIDETYRTPVERGLAMALEAALLALQGRKP